MKLINSTPWPTWFLRRMISWCAKELEMPVKACRVAKFRNSRSCWGGAARGWSATMTVCISKEESAFPQKTRSHHGELQETVADRVEALVKVTAHELTHIRNWYRAKCRAGGGHGGSEALTDTLAFAVLRSFRTMRAELLAAWNVEPVARLRAPVVPVTERRAIKAKQDLEKWQRRLKLASAKVRKLRRRVQYYETKTNDNE